MVTAKARVTAPLTQSRPKRPFPTLVVALGLTTAAAVLVSVVTVEAKWSRLLDGPDAFWRILKLVVDEWRWSDVGTCVREMWVSVAIAWVGTLLAAFVAVPLAFVAAENLVPRWWSFAMKQVFNALRAVPDLVLVIALVPIFGLRTMAGVVAIAIGSIGTLAKLCSEIIEAIDRGPVEAADAVGATLLQRMRWSVVPQVAPEITSFVLYRFEINIRISAVLGAIGAGGIGRVLRDNIEYDNWGIAGMALCTVVVATIAIDAISGVVRRRIVAGPQRSTRTTDEPSMVAEAML